MKAHLLFCDRDLDLEQPPPANAEALEQDLELPTLYAAMSDGDGDDYVAGVARHVLLAVGTSADQVGYRQEVLGDCLERPELLRELYAIAVAGVQAKEAARLFWFNDSADTLLQKSVRMLDALVVVIRSLRRFVDGHAGDVRSEGLRTLFELVQRDLDDPYLATVDEHLRELRFRGGALMSAELGRGNRGTGYVLRRPHPQRLLERLTPGGSPRYTFTIPTRDEHGAEALADLRARGIRLVASALAQSTDHVLAFFAALRAELAFYVGCVNLHDQLVARGGATCVPSVRKAETLAFAAHGLYDAALAFHLRERVVGNDVEADSAPLVLITGANQGGKSTFLRSVGLAQLMLQAGMFVAAESFDASVCSGVFTHFKREEDPGMTSGKLDEELARMSETVDAIRPGGLLLCNESFASTNEREGSEIARNVIGALVEGGVRVLFVTHLYDLASSLHREPPARAVFLRAERRADGTRTFRMALGEPEPTSYGRDSYERIFVR